jgi:hypothetical protein
MRNRRVRFVEQSPDHADDLATVIAREDSHRRTDQPMVPVDRDQQLVTVG